MKEKELPITIQLHSSYDIRRTIRILNKIIRMTEDERNNNILEYCKKVRLRLETEIKEMEQ
jgi:hypothetical protein